MKERKDTVRESDELQPVNMRNSLSCLQELVEMSMFHSTKVRRIGDN